MLLLLLLLLLSNLLLDLTILNSNRIQLMKNGILFDTWTKLPERSMATTSQWLLCVKKIEPKGKRERKKEPLEQFLYTHETSPPDPSYIE